MNLADLHAGFMHLLWRASLQGGIAVLIAWILCLSFPRLPATVKSWFWRLAYLKLFLALVWVEPIRIPVLRPTLAVSSGAPELSRASRTFSSVPITGGILVPASKAAARTTPLARPFATWERSGWVIWWMGAAAAFLRLLSQWRLARRIRLSCRLAEHDCLASLAGELSSGMKVSAPILCRSDEVSRPLLLGFWRPCLIFPEEYLKTASREELRMMLAHELAHVQRRDLAWLWLVAAAQVVFFFHPLVWLARREWLAAQEMACDEIAIRLTSGRISDYAELLVNVAARVCKPTPVFVSAGIIQTKQTLKRRINSMKRLTQPASTTVRLLATILLGSALVALMPIRLVAAKSVDPGETDQKSPTGSDEASDSLGVRSTGTSTPGSDEAKREGSTPRSQNSRSIAVYTERSGIIRKLEVKPGDLVKTGQVLIELDNAEALARLKTVEARANVAEAALTVEKLRYADLKRDFSRKQKLVEEKALSVDELPNLEILNAQLQRI